MDYCIGFSLIDVSDLEPKLTELTAVEIEVKGVCEPYRVSLEPCVISIPGQILLETTLKKSFKVIALWIY